MKHTISNDNIGSFDEISQEASHWQVTLDSVSYTVTVLRYFRKDGEIVYGGGFKCDSQPELGGDACSDFFPDESQALNDLLRIVMSFGSIRGDRSSPD
jgi:hypothetical protein